MRDISQTEIREDLKNQNRKTKDKSTASFTFFSLIFVLVNMYMIFEVMTVNTQSAVVMSYLYNKWIALSLSSGLAALISKN